MSSRGVRGRVTRVPLCERAYGASQLHTIRTLPIAH
jgi:hypothetical protein